MRTSHRGSEVKRLYEEGLSDYEISSKLGISIWTVRYWRRKFKLRSNPSQRVCRLCRRKFRGFGKAKYCPKCREEIRKLKGIQFQIIKRIRYHLYYLLENAPETFYKVIREMEKEEGEEFVNLIIKGMRINKRKLEFKTSNIL